MGDHWAGRFSGKGSVLTLLSARAGVQRISFAELTLEVFVEPLKEL